MSTGTCIDMSIDMCIDMPIDMSIDICMDMLVAQACMFLYQCVET